MGIETGGDKQFLAGIQTIILGGGISFDAFNDEIKEDFLHLYESSFPINEQRDIESIEQLLSDVNGIYRVKVYLLDHRVVAFITTHEHNALTYIEHLCVAAPLRGSGLGRYIVHETTKNRTTPVVLEVDPADTDEWSVRRIKFYERIGFNMLQREYYQPPYRKGEPSIKLEIMMHGDLQNEDIVGILHSFYPTF